MQSALQVLTHRGPDDCGSEIHSLPNGVLTFGHTRLSIIDLTSGGHQPMTRNDGRYSMIYNGEIYNYKELRYALEGEGEVFASNSDSEVLLAAWSRWKEHALPRLKGMFAFAVYDSRLQSLTLVRDAFGIKPLYYSDRNGQFVFASEVGAVQRLVREKLRINLQRAYDYLVFGSYDDVSDTFFEGVKHLLPGHALTFDLNAGHVSSVQRWWWPDVDEQSGETFAQAVEQVRERFLDNVRLHLRSDVPLGAALSGGIDSSAIVCSMRQLEPDIPIHTFTFAARGSSANEESWADLVNQRVDAIPHKVEATPTDLAADLPDMIRAQGEPFGSTSIYAQYRVFKLAKESGITVTLEGQGGDELFAGYHGFPGPVLRSLIERGELLQALRFADQWSEWPGRSRKAAVLALGQEVVPNGLRNLALGAIGQRAEPEWIDANWLRDRDVRLTSERLPREHRSSKRRLSAALRASMVRRILPPLLRHGDRNAMRWSVESRVPFLTTDLAEYTLRLPDSYLVSPSGETKRVLRAAMRGIVPDAVLDRPDKVGFATPELSWLISIRDTVREWLAADGGLPFFRTEVALREFDRVVAGKRPFTWQVWRWINLCQWHRIFG